MLKYVKGDFFDYKADIRVNTVNCVGVMGAGVAKSFKSRYPDMFKNYANACSKGEVKIGKPHIWNETDMFTELTIINLPTKIHWKNPSKYEYIEKGLQWLKSYLLDKENSIITLPALGCGHGGLDWDNVKSLIEKYLSNLRASILVFTPESSTDYKMESDLKDKLRKKNIKILKPHDDIYPRHLKGRSASVIYYLGNIELLENKKMALIVTPKPCEREKKALYSFIDELPIRDFAFLLNYNNSFEIDIINKVISLGFKAIVTLPFGILQLKIRKDLKELWNENNILTLSLTHPSQTWKSYESIKTVKLRIKISDAIVINSITYSKLKNFRNDLISTKSNKFYINYWNEQLDFFKSIFADKIGLNPVTRRPNIAKIIGSF